ncbi:MAG TPA: hypothetical protein VF284_05285 [Rhodanobacteraceae bacterium]
MRAHSRTSVSILSLALLIVASAAFASPPPESDTHGHWVGAAGMSLYTYGPDGTLNVSHCSGPCAAIWPPYLADPGAKPANGFGLVSRPGDRKQWSYQGRPLYRYAGHTKPGMATGDGVNGVWHVATTNH